MSRTARSSVRSRAASPAAGLWACAVCALLLGLAGCAARGFDVQPERLRLDEHDLHVDVILPKSGVPSVDAALRATADELVAQARAAEIPPGTPWTREVFGDYESFRAGRGVWSFLLSYGLFTGGAHPIPVVETLVFDLATGRRLVFADVFRDDQAALDTLASYVAADLLNRQGLDADWVSGAFADPLRALARFVLRESGPVFVFPPYEVAPYAWGTITVPLPWAAVRDALRPEFTVLHPGQE